MLNHVLFLVPLLFATAVALPSSPSHLRIVTRPAQDSIARLSWMAGCWQQRAGPRVVDEQWMLPAGQAMVGMSRTVAGGRMRAWESLRIVEEAGRVTYIAQPGGGVSTSFPATSLSDTLAIFENPAHDFPQRIAYRRLSGDSLVATISAARDGRVQRMDIPMRRTSCER